MLLGKQCIFFSPCSVVTFESSVISESTAPKLNTAIQLNLFLKFMSIQVETTMFI